jgi:transposase
MVLPVGFGFGKAGCVMIGTQDRWQEELFVACSLRELVPDDHILKRVDTVLELSWLEGEVCDCYCPDNGRPSIAPEAAVRLMLAGFFAGIVHDRKLMREAQVNLAIRWFAGYRLHERLPDHSSLTRIRQRWGPERFRRVLERTIAQCIERGLVSAETVHVDATLIRAHVSWESLSAEYGERLWRENQDQEPTEEGPPPAGESPEPARPPKKRSRTDPDATMAPSNKRHHLEPSYKQHTAVDSQTGVILDAEVTTGEASEGGQLLAQIERIERRTGQRITTLTADAGYAHGGNYQALQQRGTEAVIPPQPEPRNGRTIPLRRFKYDAKHQVVRCPGGRVLHPRRTTPEGTWYEARAQECRACPLRGRCLSAHARRRRVLIVDGYSALLRARRQRRQWDERTRGLYRRHRWRVEGVHGEAKTQHGLGRAVRWGLANMAIQAYLTAAAINLKRLAALSLRPSGRPGRLFHGIAHLLRTIRRLWDLLQTRRPIPCAHPESAAQRVP